MRTFISPFFPLIILLLFLPAGAQDLQSAGQVVVTAPSGPSISLKSTNWQDLPQLKGALTLPKGGHLAISVTIEGVISGAGAMVHVRALIDGVVAHPDSTVLMTGQNTIGTNTCSFNGPALAAGVHKVRIQYRVSSGTTFWLGDRNLVMRFAAYNSNTARLGFAWGPTSSIPGTNWIDLKGVATPLVLPWDARLEISITGEFRSNVKDKRVFVRAMVDNKLAVQGSQVIATGAHRGILAHTFTTNKIARGTRNVKIQWSGDAMCTVAKPVMTVTALPDNPNPQTGFVHQVQETTAISTTLATWTDIPNLGGNLWQPAPGDLVVDFSSTAYTYGTGKRLFLRSLVDGKPANPSDMVICTEGTRIQSHRTRFALRNQTRGWHTIKMQWRVDSGGQAYIGDRALTVSAMAGQTPLLVVGLESDRGAPNYKYGGLFANSVINTVGSKRVFKPYVGDWFYRSKPGVADWFLENSRQHLYLVEAALLGPYKKMYTEQYYRSQVPNCFQAMKIEALKKADADFDYSYYDYNGDGLVKTDELPPLIVMYQDTNFGEVRGLPLIVTNDGVTLDYSGWGQGTFYTPDFTTTNQRGTACHELCHLLLKAGDMYENGYEPSAPGPFSIMDQHGWSGHLDPMHKVKQAGWFEYHTVEKEGWHDIAPISENGLVFRLRDKTSHAGEYFLVENRQNINYNNNLPDAGLAIWHCDESRLPNWRTAVEIEPESGYVNPPNYKNYLFGGSEGGFPGKDDFWDNSKSNSRWHDTTMSGIGVWGVRPAPGKPGTIRAYFDLPGPGVMVQFENPLTSVNALGEVITRVRVVNTSTVADAFRLTLNVAGTASWTTTYTGNMTPYQQKIINLTVKPNQTGRNLTFTVTGESTLNTGARSSDTTYVNIPLMGYGNPIPGGRVTLDGEMPGEAGRGYIMCASLGHLPGFNIPGSGHLALNPDAIFFAAMSLPIFFENFIGVMDGQGRSKSYFNIINEPLLKGFDFYFAYVTYDYPGAFREISNTIQVKIQ